MRSGFVKVNSLMRPPVVKVSSSFSDKQPKLVPEELEKDAKVIPRLRICNVQKQMKTYISCKEADENVYLM